MAHVNEFTSRPHSGLGIVFSGVMIDLRARLARRRVYNQTINELRALSDRELNDLGLSRSHIRRIAYEAAYDM